MKLIKHDIGIVHRIDKPRSSLRLVIVRMLRKRHKYVIMRGKHLMNNPTINRSIFLIDDLTWFGDNILCEARQLKKQHQIKNAF